MYKYTYINDDYTKMSIRKVGIKEISRLLS